MEKSKYATAYQRPFLVEVATVLLAVLVIIELIPRPNVYSSISGLGLSINQILGLVVIFNSFIGIYGLLSGDKIGIYFAILAPTFEIASDSFSIIEAYNLEQLGSYITFRETIVLASSFSAVMCLLKVNSKQRVPDVSSDSHSTSQVNKYAVEAVDVSKTYVLESTTVSAVKGLNVKVPKGEFLAIMGPSGSGKSTLLNLIGALDRPSSGQILIDGVNISTLDDRNLAKLRNEKIGLVFQSYNLIDRSKVIRNMELPAMVIGLSKRERLERIHNLLKMVGLDEKAFRKPKTMSGGEQQRIAIARALVNDPKIVLADEPTGNLDSKTGNEIMNFLKKMNLEKGTTLIIVTHSREVAEMADRIINFRDGTIVNEERLRN